MIDTPSLLAEILSSALVPSSVRSWTTITISGVVLLSFLRQWRCVPWAWSIALLTSRFASIGLVSWMLTEPAVVQNRYEGQRSDLSVLIDTSESMGVRDVSHPETALTSEQSRLREQVGRLDFCFFAAHYFSQRVQSSMTMSSEPQLAIADLDHSLIFLNRASDLVGKILADPSAQAHRLESNLGRIAGSIQSIMLPGFEALRQQLSQHEDLSIDSDELETSWEEAMNELALVNQQTERCLRGLGEDLEPETTDTYLSRLDAARQLIDRHLQPSLQQNTQGVAAQYHTFDQNVRPASEPLNLAITPQSNTDLLRAVKYCLRQPTDSSGKGVLLFTDGRQTASTTLARSEMDQAEIPLFVVPLGQSRETPDARLLHVISPNIVLEKDTIVIKAVVSGRHCDGQSAELVLRRGKEILDRATIAFRGELFDQRVTLQTPTVRPGMERLELELTTNPLEKDSTNNHKAIEVLVVKERSSVLLIENAPRWEYRFLVQLFRRDETIQLSKLLVEMPHACEGAIVTLGRIPRDASEWSPYDVIILGDVSPDDFGSAEQRGLYEHIARNGGQLVVIAGTQSMPQRYQDPQFWDLLPIEKQSASDTDELPLRLTDLGEQHLATQIGSNAQESLRQWQTAFSSVRGAYVSPFCRPKPAAQTLIEFADSRSQPVESSEFRPSTHAYLTWHQLAAGRVVYLASPTTFQLRFRQGDPLHHRFWGQLIRWLSSTASKNHLQFVLESNRDELLPGESMIVTASLEGVAGQQQPPDTLKCSITNLSTKQKPIEYLLHRRTGASKQYSAEVTLKDVGQYSIELADSANRAQLMCEPQLVQVVSRDAREMRVTSRDQILLDRLVAQTGGRFLTPAAIPDLVDLLQMQRHEFVDEQRFPLWNHWWVLAVMLSCFLVDWLGRRWLGFP